MTPQRYAEQLTARLRVAGIPAVRVHYTRAYRYSVGMTGTAAGSTVLVHRITRDSAIPSFTAQHMTRREATAFVAGLCIAAQCA